MYQVIVGCAGGLIAGESALLLIGMNYPYIASWATAKNVVLAVADVILGAVLLYLSVFAGKYLHDLPIYVVVAVLLGTHTYREIEHLRGSRRRFTFSFGLFLFNNVRIALLLAALGFAGKYTFPKIAAIL